MHVYSHLTDGDLNLCHVKLVLLLVEKKTCEGQYLNVVFSMSLLSVVTYSRSFSTASLPLSICTMITSVGNLNEDGNERVALTTGD